MAALIGALIPAPNATIIVLLLINGIPATESILLILAGILSHATIHGFGLMSGIYKSHNTGQADETRI